MFVSCSKRKLNFMKQIKILVLPFVVQTQSCFNEWDQLLHFSFAFFNFVPRLEEGQSQCSCTCAHQGDLLLWLFPQACYPSNKPISILLSSKTDSFKSKKNSSTQSMSKWVMLYRTPFDKTQFLEISRCWRELRALPAQLDIPANHRPLLGKSWRGGRKSRHGLRTAFQTVTTTEDDFSLYFLSNGTPATSWWWFQIILLASEKNKVW